jgi:hypothetical protein
LARPTNGLIPASLPRSQEASENQEGRMSMTAGRSRAGWSGEEQGGEKKAKTADAGRDPAEVKMEVEVKTEDVKREGGGAVGGGGGGGGGGAPGGGGGVPDDEELKRVTLEILGKLGPMFSALRHRVFSDTQLLVEGSKYARFHKFLRHGKTFANARNALLGGPSKKTVRLLMEKKLGRDPPAAQPACRAPSRRRCRAPQQVRD